MSDPSTEPAPDPSLAVTADERRFGDTIHRLRHLLVDVYGDDAAHDLIGGILESVAATRAAMVELPADASEAAAPSPGGALTRFSQRDAVLISYGDSILDEDVAPLRALDAFLLDHVDGAFSTLHVLPFYPFSSDDGFSVIDYHEVNPSLGDWPDIHALAGHYRLMADLVINHVSRESLWFMDFVNDREPGRDYFLSVDPSVDLSMVVRPRNTPLLVPVHTYRGLRHVWATFSEDQIDLDFSNPRVLLEFVRILCFYLRNGARVVRLDAIGFLWKEIGTDCMHHINTHRIVRVLRLVAEMVHPGVVLITETNVPHSENVSYFGSGDEAHMVYQFSLAPLTLHALMSGSSHYLMQWVGALGAPPRGCGFLNFTASHDGIGLRPAEGLVPEDELTRMVDLVHELGGFASLRTLPDGSHRPYELNISLFDAMGATFAGRDAHQFSRFMASQVLTLSLQGVPAVYIHSLLATPNDHEGVERTGRTRSINRRQWRRGDLDVLLADADSAQARALDAMCRLLRIRADEAAFAPTAGQQVLPVSDALVTLVRGEELGPERVAVVVNVTAREVSLDPGVLGLEAGCVDLLAEGAPVTAPMTLAPYQCCWLRPQRD